MSIKTSQINVYKEGDHPLFGNSVTSIKVEDEGGGPYLTLEQCSDTHTGSICLDMSELDQIFEVCFKLREEFKDCQ